MKLTKLLILSSLTIGLSGCLHSASDEPRPSEFTLENVERLVKEDILKPEQLDPSEKDYKYLVGATDLNNDGSEELLVLMQDSYFCGSGGCTAYLFSSVGDVITRMTVTRKPILVSDRITNGWRDFYVWSNGSLRVMSFDGKSYPSNPSVEPEYSREREKEIAKQTLEVQEVVVQDGYGIELVEDLPIFYPAHSYQFTFRHYGDPQNLYLFKINMVTGESELETLPIPEQKADTQP